LQRESLESSGIVVRFDEQAAHKAVALIVGPADTPYEGGLYLFEITFPDNYPANPPKVLIRTTDGRVRFNPNLYVDGKVCLSILGTWQGEQWSPALTLMAVLLSVQSLMNSKPLQNEPGYESYVGPDGELYSQMLRYENVAVTPMQLATPLPELFAPMREAMVAAFHLNFEAYMKVLMEFDRFEGQSNTCRIYLFATQYSPSKVRNALMSLRSSLLQEAGLPETRVAIIVAPRALAPQTCIRLSASSSVQHQMPPMIATAPPLGACSGQPVVQSPVHVLSCSGYSKPLMPLSSASPSPITHRMPATPPGSVSSNVAQMHVRTVTGSGLPAGPLQQHSGHQHPARPKVVLQGMPAMTHAAVNFGVPVQVVTGAIPGALSVAARGTSAMPSGVSVHRVPYIMPNSGAGP